MNEYALTWKRAGFAFAFGAVAGTLLVGLHMIRGIITAPATGGGA